MLIYLLLVIIMLFWLISYIFTKKDILSLPSIFCGTFIISILFAIPNLEKWNFDMGERTFGVIFLGIVSYCISFFIIYYLFIIKNKNLKYMKRYSPVCITKKKIYLFLIVQIITALLVYIEISKIAALYGMTDSLAEKILAYRVNYVMEGDVEAKLPSYVEWLYGFSYFGTYILIYKMACDYYNKIKVPKIYILVVSIEVIISLLFGNRGFSINLLIYLSILYYIFYLRKSFWVINIKKITIIKIGIVMVGALVLFPTLGAYIIGRTNDDFFDRDMMLYIWDNLSIYIGAPLKLLDLYLYTDYTDVSDMPLGFATFQNIYSWIALKLNIINWQVTNLGLEFRTDNFSSLGNVYTIFRPFMMDFGYIGVIVFTLFMGTFSAIFYYLIKYKRSLWNRSNIDYYTIFYGYLFCQILFSFFSNRFYGNIFSFSMIKTIILCFIFEYIFIKRRNEEQL
ncbi:Uncharacterised protein [Megamonas hypermegale]|uniref:Oligosaccharide repeat unit polymerase n=1 Tax=Megamonas hypermegale TaxID=158847 RepID=A0A378NUN6_9FIRM|nr:Uncharacterised protein [Megamonas hypermegale]